MTVIDKINRVSKSLGCLVSRKGHQGEEKKGTGNKVAASKSLLV